jgi:hypothetical protein
MKLSATKLRNDVYSVLDHILETGQHVEVERKGKILKIIPAQTPDKLSRLKKRKLYDGDGQNLVHIDWSKFWKPDV